jgi:hypothetical protein
MLKSCVQILALLIVQSGAALGLQTTDPAQWRDAAQKALTARGDANSLATAAVLAFAVSTRPRADPAKTEVAALDLAVRASDSAPQDAAIGWMHLQLCARAARCDIRDAATTLRWVDADNSAAWLPTLAAAQKDRDAMEVDRVLVDMAQGARFDFYWNRIIVLTADSLRSVRSELPQQAPRSDATRISTMTGLAAAELIPSFLPLNEACREPAAGTERRESCLKLSKIMQRGDTVAAQLAGLGLEKHLVAPDGKEARAIAERRRVLEWRVSTAAQFDTPLLPWLVNARARSRLALMRSLPREEDVCVAMLKKHGMATEPPENR